MICIVMHTTYSFEYSFFLSVCVRVCPALQKSDSDVKAMKQQAENLTIEYDRLLEEHGKLQVGPLKGWVFIWFDSDSQANESI